MGFLRSFPSKNRKNHLVFSKRPPGFQVAVVMVLPGANKSRTSAGLRWGGLPTGVLESWWVKALKGGGGSKGL